MLQNNWMPSSTIFNNLGSKSIDYQIRRTSGNGPSRKRWCLQSVIFLFHCFCSAARSFVTEPHTDETWSPELSYSQYLLLWIVKSQAKKVGWGWGEVKLRRVMLGTVKGTTWVWFWCCRDTLSCSGSRAGSEKKRRRFGMKNSVAWT